MNEKKDNDGPITAATIQAIDILNALQAMGLDGFGERRMEGNLCDLISLFGLFIVDIKEQDRLRKWSLILKLEDN